MNDMTWHEQWWHTINDNDIQWTEEEQPTQVQMTAHNFVCCTLETESLSSKLNILLQWTSIPRDLQTL